MADERNGEGCGKLYFMGICGTAMGNVALLMRDLGYAVSGADTGVYPPMSDVLARSGITVHEGYDAGRLARLKPDLVVVGNVITRGNQEIEWLLNTRAFPFTSIAALLHDHLLRPRHNIVVTGTHGKTTTTSIAAFLLRNNRVEPGYLIGGVPRDLPGGARLGEPDAPFVIEGDEYDCAFFDKRSKFIHYRPSTLIINNLEFDHQDIFRDLDDIKRSFNHLLRLVPSQGHVVANGDDTNLEALLDVGWTTVVRVGTGPQNDLRIADFRESAEGTRFTLVWKGRRWDDVEWKLPGLFNARNAAAAALAAGLSLHPDNPTQLELGALSGFRGVKRRQEILHNKGPLTIMEDFAHHPSAVRETLVSLRARYPDAKLTAVFEPRSNTAVRNTFQEEFTDALSQADSVLLGALHRRDKIPPELRLDTAEITKTLSEGDRTAAAFESNRALLDALVEGQPGDEAEKQLVVFFSNGSFDGIIQKFVRFAKDETDGG